ncbi:MAG TPA: hypothetical protein VJG90_06355 [Candidatus Nanoarchaeia archaeon]|nr:hypothetical protein [Candidatus Nanoarchaeia archaeon]
MNLDWVWFLLACVIIFGSASLLLKSLMQIAMFLRVSEFVAGFILLGLATSLPELFIGISSALGKNPALGLGNVLGANILDLTLVIGIPILLARSIKLSSHHEKKDTLEMFFIALIPLVLMVLGGGLSRLDGVILIVIFVLYTIHLIQERKGFHKVLKDGVSREAAVVYSVLFVLALGALFYASGKAVFFATMISADLQLPPIFIGLFILSLGTTLPELTVGLTAVLRKEPEVVVGNVVGSVVANSTLVLGITALISPIEASLLYFLSSAAFMLVAAFLFATFVDAGKRLYWKEGIALILLYVFFLIVELNLKGLISTG